MPTIEERESEHDNEEELDRKADAYNKKIERLKKDVENLKSQLSSTTLEDSLARINLEAHQFKSRNQIISELLAQTPGQIQEADLDKLIAMYTGMIELEESTVKVLDAKVNRYYSFDRFM